MPYVMGTDEAGYGPNLGPLVISASLWEVPASSSADALHDCLASLTLPAQHLPVGNCRPIIGDSKQLYRPGNGLAALELGVLAALSVASPQAPWSSSTFDAPYPDTWRKLLDRCDGSSLEVMSLIPWYCKFDTPLPIDATGTSIAAAGAQFRNQVSKIGGRLLELRSRTIFPEAFNRRLQDGFNKATALSSWTLELIHSLLEAYDDFPVLIHCDKHGGRNRYAALLQHQFPDVLIQAVSEGKQQSVYRWGPPERRVEIRFVAKGDRFLPAALASMTSKYLRELAMLAFNAYWQSRLPALRPTAGYPVDAKRFRQEIDQLRQQLQIPEIQLWRER